MTMDFQPLNPAMLVLARESRGWNQRELAEKLGISESNLSRIESGAYSFTGEVGGRAAEATHYPVSFFFQKGTTLPDGLGFRKRQVVSMKLLTPITARVEIVRRQVQFLQETLNLKDPRLPVLDSSLVANSSEAAERLRRLWKVHEPVVSNMVGLLEQKGLPVATFTFGTDRVDSRVTLTDDRFPVIFYNSTLLGDKLRFSLAHELGHLVMHTLSPQFDLERDITHEANLFAAAFLMPETAIRKDFEGGISVAKLADLKRKWKVSMIALLYRADDLGFITANQKKYLLQQFNQLQIRRREPAELDIPVEHPQLLRQWVATLKTLKKLTTKQTAEALHMKTDEFIALYS